MTYQPEINATPAVRALAARYGVDLHSLDGRGTGVGGRIRVADVRAAASATDDQLCAALFGNSPTSGLNHLTPDERALYAALFGAQAGPLSASTVSAPGILGR